jgi:hypothetical protein
MTSAFAKKIAYRVIWVEPSLLAEIEYRAKGRRRKAPASVLQGTAGGPMMSRPGTDADGAADTNCYHSMK